MKGVEGKFISTSGEEMYVSFKDFSNVNPRKLFNFRSKLNDNIAKVNEMVRDGKIDAPVDLLFSAPQAGPYQIMDVILTKPNKVPVSVFERLQGGPFRNVYFESATGVYRMDIKTGKIIKVVGVNE